MDDWADPAFARRWDAGHLRGNPVRGEQIDVLLTLVEQVYVPGTAVLDIGVGSGIIAEAIVDRLPDARLVGIDASPAMLDLARSRLAGHGRTTLLEASLDEPATVALPGGAYSVVVAVQTLHNLGHDQQRAVFDWIRSVIDPSGVFILADRLAVPGARLFPLYRALWGRLEQIHGDPITHQPTFELERRYLSEKGDRPATLQQHLAWLEAADFEVAALQVHADRGLLAARPAGGPVSS